MDLSTVLQNTLSPEHSIRQHASRTLEEAARSIGLSNYLSTLIGLLGKENENAPVRIAAGLAAKNALVNRRDAVRQADMAERWLGLPLAQRQTIHRAALNALSAASAAVGTTAAQVVAAIACIELAADQWDDLLPSLVNNMTDPQTPTNIKRASVETIGFVCEESDRIGAVLERRANAILTAVVNGMMSGEMAVRVASCRALLNSLEFASSAFGNPNERAFIMQRVCETAAQTGNEELSVIALQCLVRIVNLYYHCLPEFMSGGLEQLTISSMQQSEHERIQLQAIEFWSTICEVEFDLADQLADTDNEDHSQSIFNFPLAALPRLLPILLWLLTLHSNEYGEAVGASDDWTPAMAAATCLTLLANTVGDAIMASGQLLSFVQTNIMDASDWRKREAAAMAFGSVLDGPDPRHMAGLVSTALPHLISLLSDQSVAVRDTTAWCIGEACRGFADSIPPELLPSLSSSLVQGLQDRPRVAANCAWASANLVEQLADSAMIDPGLFAMIMQALLQAAMRSDASDANLRTCAFQALANVVGKAPISSRPVVDELANFLVSQLDALSSAQFVNADDRMRTQELQGHYASILQSAIKVLERDQVLLFSDGLMAALLSQLAPVVSNASSRPPTPTVDDPASNGSISTAAAWEDLLMLLGAIFACIGESSDKYIDNVAPVLAAALSGAYHLETSLCIIAIIDIGELAQATKADFLPLAQPFVQLLASVLSSKVIPKVVKPKAISAIGDIALAIGPAFASSSNILSSILPIFLQAAQAVSQPPSDMDDWEHVDFVLEMRLALVETFSCIVQGSSDDSQSLRSLSPNMPIILSFLKSIIALRETEYEAMVSDPLVKAAIGLIGDTASAYSTINHSAPVSSALKEPWIGSFLASQKRRRNLPESIDTVLRYALSQMARI